MSRIPGRLPLLAVLAIGTVLGAACSRDKGLGCESPERYGSAESRPPLRVPDDLSVPDETEVLRIPGARAGGQPGPEPGRPCLESPPDFSEGAADGNETG